MKHLVRHVRATRELLVREMGLNALTGRDVFLSAVSLSVLQCLSSLANGGRENRQTLASLERFLGALPSFLLRASHSESLVVSSSRWLPPELVRMIAHEPLSLGWAYQVWNEEERDNRSWGISRKGDGRTSLLPAAVVTQIFTEEYMASFLAERCRTLHAESGNGDVLDPACGAGHLLIPALRRQVRSDSSAKSAETAGIRVLEKLHGCDIDPDVVEVCRLALLFEIVRSSPVHPQEVWQIVSSRILEAPSPHGSLDRNAQVSALQRTFDWVITNPPYIGRRKLSPEMREFLDVEYPSANMDLCAAFMCRCVELTAPGGALGLVTNDKWLRLKGYESLRTGGEGFAGLYRTLSLDVVCELGQRAFSPISNLHDGVGTALLTARKVDPSDDHMFTFLSCADDKTPEGKARALDLVQTCTSSQPRVEQRKLVEKGGSSTFVAQHGLPGNLLNSVIKVKDRATVVVGLQTNDDRRFVRYVWSVPPDRTRWVVHSKGGGFGRWYGLNRFVLDWGTEGAAFASSRHGGRNLHPWFSKAGWTYSWFANGALGLRRKEGGWSFGRAASSGFFTDDDRVVGILNSRVGSLMARRVGGKAQLPEGVVRSLPLPPNLEPVSSDLIEAAVEIKKMIVAADPTEVSHAPDEDWNVFRLSQLQAILLMVEGALETQVARACALQPSEEESLDGSLGRPVAWFRRVAAMSVDDAWRVLPPHLEFLRNAVENECPGMKYSLAIDVEERVRRYLDNGVRSVGSRNLLPSTSPLESLCRATELHPFDALRGLTSLCETNFDVRRQVELPLLRLRIQREILRALGHQWWMSTSRYDSSLHHALSARELSILVAEKTHPIDCERLLGENLHSWIASKMERWHSQLFLNSPLIVRCTTTTGKEPVFGHAWAYGRESTDYGTPESSVGCSL